MSDSNDPLAGPQDALGTCRDASRAKRGATDPGRRPTKEWSPGKPRTVRFWETRECLLGWKVSCGKLPLCDDIAARLDRPPLSLCQERRAGPIPDSLSEL